MNNTYLMRSLMFVPAHNQKLLDSAVRRDADVLLLDIEDSVPFAENSFPVTILRILLNVRICMGNYYFLV